MNRSNEDVRAFEPRELTAEARSIAEARYASQLGAQRTPRFLAGTMALCAAFWAMTLLPGVSGLLRVAPAEMGASMLVVAIAIAIATWSARAAFGGVLGRPHRIVERIESAVIAAVLATLIYLSGSAVSFFWVIVILHVLPAMSDGLHSTFARRAYLACFALLAVAFELTDRRSDALIVAVLGVVIGFIAAAQERSVKKFLDVLAERNLYRQRFEAVLVERERQRIARDLHDGLGGQLSALAWVAEGLSLEDSEVRERLGNISERARTGLADLRALLQCLSANDMGAGDLARSLEHGVRPLAASRCDLEIVTAGEGTIDSKVCFQVGLIVREAVQNAIRHGGARHIRISLDCSDVLTVRVVDDGCGIPEGVLETSRGGLANMRYRAKTLGASIDFETSSSGTSVAVSFVKPFAPHALQSRGHEPNERIQAHG